MSVIMTFRVAANPDELERITAENPDAARAISENAKQYGIIAHRFYGADGQVMVIDEWPDPDSFHRFFEANREAIEGMMAQVGVAGEPEVMFWRALDTHDAVGWGAES